MHAVVHGVSVQRGVQGGYQGGYSRVGNTGVYREGYTGYYPATALAQPAKRAPEAPNGGWSGWVGRPLRDPEKYLKYSSFWDPFWAPGDHPCGARSVPLAGTLPVTSPAKGEIRPQNLET